MLPRCEGIYLVNSVSQNNSQDLNLQVLKSSHIFYNKTFVRRTFQEAKPVFRQRCCNIREAKLLLSSNLPLYVVDTFDLRSHKFGKFAFRCDTLFQHADHQKSISKLFGRVRTNPLFHNSCGQKNPGKMQILEKYFMLFS